MVRAITCPLIHRQKKGLHLLLHPQKPYWLIVNTVGYEILQHCDGTIDEERIADILANHYGKRKEELLPDIQLYVEEISRKGWFFTPQKKTTLHSPLSLKRVHLNITEACNQSCLHCGAVAGTRREEELTREEVFYLVDRLVKLGVDSLAITGGEPFLRKDLLEIVEYASDRMNTILSTNATLITPDMAQMLKGYKQLTIQVSLDGATPEIHDRIRGEGSFAKTIQGIEHLVAEGIENCHLCAVVTRLNRQDSIPILSLAREMKIKGIRFLPLQKLGKAKEKWSDLALSLDEQEQFYRNLYREVIDRFPEVKISTGFQGFSLQDTDTGMWCQIGRSLAITSNGDVYPCPLLTDEQFSLGSLRQRALDEIVYSTKREQLVRDCSARLEEVNECKSCDWRGFCQGGCPASVYLELGNHLGVDGLCQLRSELYESLLFSLPEKRSNTANDVCC